MPDPSTEREIPAIPLDRPAVNEMAGPHNFIPSEFAPESGRCDRCGGGPLAEIHQKPVDQMARIADALERIAVSLEALQDIRDTLDIWESLGHGLYERYWRRAVKVRCADDAE